MNTINSTFEMTPDKKRFSINDSIWALFVIAGAFYAWLSFGHIMDAYEDGILVGSAIGLIMLGRFWPSAKTLSYAVATLSLFALWTYAQHNNQISANEQAFFLKFLISSQSAFMWMSALFVLSTLGYFAGLFFKSDFTAKIASVLAWSGATFGLVGMMVRWRESYLINPEYGHIPVSSLYEVFILFAVLTTLMYLYYE